jgi:hypothetical protein
MSGIYQKNGPNQGSKVILAVERFKRQAGLYDETITKEEIVRLVNAAIRADNEEFV